MIQTPTLTITIVLILVVLPLAVYGTDVSTENTMQEVPASKILAKIQNGEPIEYDHIIVKGDLDTSLETSITSPIRINNSIFKGFVNFSNTTLYESIDFSGSNFTKNIDFSGTVFSGDAIFRDAHFSGVAKIGGFSCFFENAFGDACPNNDFVGVIFKQKADFSGATFSGIVNFSGAQFSVDRWSKYSHTTKFSRTRFGGNTYFVRAKFGGAADFNGAYFSRWASFIGAEFNLTDFDGATFGGIAFFYGAAFRENVNFNSASFYNIANFGDYWGKCIFSGDANFDRADFSGDADFSRATFSRSVNFNSATLKENASFEGATFSNGTNFSGAGFSGDADFKDVKLSGYFIGWANVKNALICDKATYLGLIKNFKDHGQFDEADDCYYTYRSRNMEGPSDLMARITCGFGVRWLQTIYFGLFWLLLFGSVYFLMIASRSGFNKEMIIRQLLDSFWFSAMVLLSVPSELYPKKVCTYKEYIREIKYHLPILERLIGWGTLILFINTLSRAMLHT